MSRVYFGRYGLEVVVLGRRLSIGWFRGTSGAPIARHGFLFLEYRGGAR